MKEPLVVNNLEGKWFENTYKLCEVNRERESCVVAWSRDAFPHFNLLVNSLKV